MDLIFYGVFIALLGTSCAADDDSFSFGAQPATASPVPTPTIEIVNIVPPRKNFTAENGSRAGRLLAQNNRNVSLTAKSRSLAIDPSFFAGQGGSTSLETNFLSIQSGGSKFTQTNGPNGNLIGFNPQGYQSGGSIPVGGQVPIDFRPVNPSVPTSDNGVCRCELYADCRDISAFARSDRTRQGYCPPGEVLCCSRNQPIGPSYPVNGDPPPLPPIPAPYPSVNPYQPSIVGPLVQPNPNTQLAQKCGIKGGNPLARTIDISNPRGDAEFGEYPWMTAILKTDLNYVCGGVLLADRLVLTAAHCVAKVKGEDLLVRLGEFDVSEITEPPHQDIHVKKVIIHGDYHSGTLRNDIALLLLDQPALLSSYIRPICMPPTTGFDFTGMTCTVSGWGKNSPVGKFSTTLKEVDVPVIDRNQCQNMLRNAPELGALFNLHDSFLCAGQAGKDACAGDGGSPLVCKVDGAWRLAGLVSWGIGCGQYPGAYVNVAKYLPWIQGVLQESFKL